MKRTYIFALLLIMVSCETKNDQLSIDDVIAQSLELDNTNTKQKSIIEKDVSSRSLSKELSQAFSKIIAATPLKSENLPVDDQELDNLKQEETQSQISENKSQASNVSDNQMNNSPVSEQSTTNESDKVDLSDEALTDDKSITVDSSNKSGLEATNVSGNIDTNVEEASAKTKVSELSQLEDQNEVVDNLEALPVDKDEEETSQKEKDLQGNQLFMNVNL
jgi:hypothetical protein